MDRLSAADLTELSGICPGGVRRDVGLSAISQWRIGGSADLVVQPEDTEQVAKLLSWFGTRGIKPVVIGLSNILLFDDAGLRAPCIQIGPRMGQLSIDGTDARWTKKHGRSYYGYPPRWDQNAWVFSLITLSDGVFIDPCRK